MTKKAATKTPSKKPTKSPAKSTKPEEPSIKSITTSKFPTISGKSTLTYNLGVDVKGLLHVRIFSNSGGGFFSNEWIKLDEITSILKEVPVDHPITSMDLFPLFKGKSVNTPGYLMAVLFNEKLLSPFKDTKRQYVYTGKDTLKPKVTKRKKTKKSK